MAKLDQAESFLKRARNKREEAQAHLEKVNYAEAVSAAQESTEFSVKALLKACGVSFKKTHEVEELDFARALRKIPDVAASVHNFPRAFLLARFWSRFYKEAKYGYEELGVGADKLFKREEAELAVGHARECYNACDFAFREIRWPQ